MSVNWHRAGLGWNRADGSWREREKQEKEEIHNTGCGKRCLITAATVWPCHQSLSRLHSVNKGQLFRRRVWKIFRRNLLSNNIKFLIWVCTLLIWWMLSVCAVTHLWRPGLMLSVLGCCYMMSALKWCNCMLKKLTMSQQVKRVVCLCTVTLTYGGTNTESLFHTKV